MINFPSARYPQSQTKSHDMIAVWVQALHGQGSIETALSELLRLIAGDAALLMRSYKDAGRQPQQIEQIDLQAHKSTGQKRHSFGFDLFSDYLSVMHIGSDLSLDEAAREGIIDRESIKDIRRRIAIYDIHDIVVVPLARNSGHMDYLELHFRSGILESNKTLLQMIASTLAKAWCARLPGTAEKAILKHRSRNGRSPDQDKVVSILVPSNPFDLSRCEFRICTLIREGQLAKSIAQQLNIKDSTVRSHLRSIYMKTETTCHAELLYKLTG
jgi:DNA-binding CsgD family transcriptional regulator